MKGTIGKAFLENYIIRTAPTFDTFAQQKIKESGAIGSQPQEIASRFFELATLGKKIRGALVTLGYQAAEGRDTKAIDVASFSIELFHAGVLVQDDIMDRDQTRRGLPALHKRFEGMAPSESDAPHYGLSQGILAGDLGFFYAYEVLASGNFPDTHRLKATSLFSEYICRVVMGQMMDITNAVSSKTTETDVVAVMLYKTAEYTGVLPLLLGATLAGATDKTFLKALREYGLALGWAFQVQDDVLGVYGKSRDTGKPVGSDIREAKNTLLMLHFNKHANSEAKQHMHTIIRKTDLTESDLQEVQQLFEQSGSLGYVKEKGISYVQEGLAQIPAITSDPQIRGVLESLLYLMLERIA